MLGLYNLGEPDGLASSFVSKKSSRLGILA
jgi:hypothetical protein